MAETYAAYDAEIRFADQELARLFDAMTRSGRNDDSLWIVTADHGEGLGNHSYAGHGELLYEEALRVPLLVYEKGHQASRIATLVRHVDILPTVLDARVSCPRRRGYTVPGRSLLPADVGRFGSRGRRHSRSAARQDRSCPRWEAGEIFSLRVGPWKYVVHTQGKDEFFDLRQDPFELRSLEAAGAAAGPARGPRPRHLRGGRARGPGAQPDRG